MSYSYIKLIVFLKKNLSSGFHPGYDGLLFTVYCEHIFIDVPLISREPHAKIIITTRHVRFASHHQIPP